MPQHIEEHKNALQYGPSTSSRLAQRLALTCQGYHRLDFRLTKMLYKFLKIRGRLYHSYELLYTVFFSTVCSGGLFLTRSCIVHQLRIIVHHKTLRP